MPIDATALGAIVGTPAYMSPSSAAGRPCRRVDVYSLGVIATSAGRPPAVQRPPEELLGAHIAGPPPSSRAAPRAAEGRGEIVMRALSKSPRRDRRARGRSPRCSRRARNDERLPEVLVLLYLEHAQAFLSASIIGLSPVLALGSSR